MIWFVVVMSWCCAVFADDTMVVQAQHHEKIKIALVQLKKVTSPEVMQTIKRDFELSKQCEIVSFQVQKLHAKKQVKAYFDQGCYLAVFVEQKEPDVFHWYVYDTMNVDMLAAQTYHTRGKHPRGWGHQLADAIWPHIMGHASSFASKIAYCKEVWVKKGRSEQIQKHIYMCDIDGTHIRCLVKNPTVCLAPRWNQHPTIPLLYFSENTVKNVRLMMANQFGKQKEVCSFDGLNMLPAFSPDGKQIVFCMSSQGTTQLYRSWMRGKKRICKQLTHNKGRNISPCFIDNNTIVFVSDYQTRRPQLYTMNLGTGALDRITDGGYCACPSYCLANKLLAYGKIVHGVMQLYTYDFATQQHKQLTHDAANKEECCWSPCGTYIAFAGSHGLHSRIGIYNRVTKKIRYITSKQDNCTYPAWSICYDTYLV